MTIQTVEVRINPEDAMEVMTEMDARPDPWGFTPEEHGVFRAWQDGLDEVIRIRLHPDGTWEAFTKVIVGDDGA